MYATCMGHIQSGVNVHACKTHSHTDTFSQTNICKHCRHATKRQAGMLTSARIGLTCANFWKLLFLLHSATWSLSLVRVLIFLRGAKSLTCMFVHVVECQCVYMPVVQFPSVLTIDNICAHRANSCPSPSQ